MNKEPEEVIEVSPERPVDWQGHCHDLRAQTRAQEALAEVRDAKTDLESKIADLLHDFTQQTSLAVAGLSIERLDVLGAPAIYFVSVDAKL